MSTTTLRDWPPLGESLSGELETSSIKALCQPCSRVLFSEVVGESFRRHSSSNHNYAVWQSITTHSKKAALFAWGSLCRNLLCMVLAVLAKPRLIAVAL